MLAQRAFELTLAKRHERELKNIGAVEIDKNGYRLIIGMHIAFFALLVLESLILNRTLNRYWIIFGMTFCASQFLRYWSIASLGIYWNTKILITPHHPLVKKGPYKILRHPNYLAVITELAIAPLISSCYMTSFAFTILNTFVIRRRIQIETQALMSPLFPLILNS